MVLGLMALYHTGEFETVGFDKSILRYLANKPGYRTTTTPKNKKNKKAKTKDLHLHADLNTSRKATLLDLPLAVCDVCLNTPL